MFAAKVPKVDTGTLPFTDMASSGISNIYVGDEMKLKTVLNNHEKLFVRHSDMLKEGRKNLLKTSTDNAVGKN